MMKIAPKVFMWLHIEWPAATNAALSPAKIAHIIPYYGICPYMGRVRIICCKFNISVTQCSPRACLLAYCSVPLQHL